MFRQADSRDNSKHQERTGDIMGNMITPILYGKNGIQPEIFGCTKFAVDTYTPSATTKWDNTVIPHSLGAVPKAVIILGNNVSTNYALRWAVTQDISTNPGTVASGANKNVHYYLEQSGMDSNKLTLDDTYITCGTSSTAKFISGVEYKVITMA